MVNITLKNGDCLELMKELPDGSIDTVITDPPYNISNYGNSLTKKGNDIVRADFGEWDKWDTQEEYFNWCIDWIKILEKKVVEKGSFYVFFDNHYADHLTWLIEKATSFRQKCPLIIVKNNPIPHVRKTNFRSAFERVTLFVKDVDKKPKTFNFLSQEKMKNVLFYNIGQNQTIHPTEKPMKIIKQFIEVSSNEGDTILDPFMGSGTTGVCAIKLNRKPVS